MIQKPKEHMNFVQCGKIKRMPHDKMAMPPSARGGYRWGIAPKFLAENVETFFNKEAL